MVSLSNHSGFNTLPFDKLRVSGFVLCHSEGVLPKRVGDRKNLGGGMRFFAEFIQWRFADKGLRMTLYK